MSLIPGRTVEALRYELTQAERARDAALAEVSRLMAALDVVRGTRLAEEARQTREAINRANAGRGHE